MTKDEALKMAIETLENIDGKRFQHFIDETIQSCKEALEQPAQKPVAWMDEEGIWEYEWESYSENKKPLYTHPAPSWQGLSDDEKQEAIDEAYKNFKEYCRHKVTQDINEKDGIEYWVARAIEAKLKEKNNAL